MRIVRCVSLCILGIVALFSLISNVACSSGESSAGSSAIATSDGAVPVSSAQLTTAMLDGLNLSDTDKVMIVAHPDDETLWGGAHLSEGGWLVVCLTNGNYEDGLRAREFQSAMESLGAKGVILHYPDIVSFEPFVLNDWSSASQYILQDIGTVLTYKDWAQVVTHNPDGEYGHIHHKLTSGLVTEKYSELFPNSDTLYYFGKYYPSQDAIDDVYPSMKQVSNTALALKEKVLSEDYSSQQDIIAFYPHMLPYEDWVKADEWDSAARLQS